MAAEKNQVKLVAPLKAAQEREDYQECRASVIKKHQSAGTAKKKINLQNGLAACQDRYPAVSIMTSCKKEMTVAYQDDHDGLKIALADCRQEYSKYSFNPKNLVPFAFRGEQAFFAGAGLNQPYLIRAKEDDPADGRVFMGENFGNFSCDSLYQTTFRERQPEFLLFANDPFTYTPLRHAKREDFLTFLGLGAALANPKGNLLSIHKDFGEVHYNPTLKETLNYFPLGYCHFDRKLGNIFAGIKIYYLVDRGQSQVTPYFGTAFYRNDSSFPLTQVAEAVRAGLGEQYKIFSKKPGVLMISQFEPKEFDKEGDPKNLCASTSSTPYLAIITERGNSGLAAYLLLANITNLCRYGDKIASRFLKRHF